MRSMGPLALGGILVLSLLTASHQQAPAQPAAATAQHESAAGSGTSPTSDRTAELLAEIREDLDAAARYQKKLTEASVEDGLVLRRQALSRTVKVLESLDELTGELVNLEKSGPQPELRRGVEEAHARITPRVGHEIGRLRAEIDALRARRTDTAAADRSVLEDEIASHTRTLDKLYRLAHAQIRDMEKLGMDVGAARAALTASLSERADELSGRLDLALERVADLEARQEESPDDATVGLLLAAARRSVETNTSSMDVTAELMDDYGLPTTRYRAQVVSATHEFRAALKDASVAMSLAGNAVRKATGWLVDNGPQLLLKLLLALAILVVSRIVARLAKRAVERAIDASDADVSELLRRTLVRMVTNLVMLFGVLLALSQIGIDLGPVLAGIGVAGFVIGFALQESLANFAAGVMILIYRPFDVGDVIEVAGAFGKVEHMSLVSTTILTFDNQTLVVPNRKIWGDVIRNVTAQDIRRVDMTFRISYADDIPKAERILTEIVTAHGKVLKEPAPLVRLNSLGESSMEFIVRPWSRRDDYGDVLWDVTRAVKLRFDEEGITIPLPMRDVRVHYESDRRAGDRTATDEIGGKAADALVASATRDARAI